VLVLLELLAALALVQLDEALPCLGVCGFDGGGGEVCGLGLVELVLLVQGEGEEDVAGGWVVRMREPLGTDNLGR
jgi:hypothetical protein